MISLSIFLIALALIFVSKGVVIVQQAEVVIIERLGKFDRVLQSGFNFIIPVIEAPRAIDWKVPKFCWLLRMTFPYSWRVSIVQHV